MPGLPPASAPQAARMPLVGRDLLREPIRFIERAMQVGLHQFSPGSIAWLREAAASGKHSRASLARGLCEIEDWRNSAGELCLASARKVLPRLADRLGLLLPPPLRRPNARPLEAYPDVALSCGLKELGDVRAEPVAPKDVTL